MLSLVRTGATKSEVPHAICDQADILAARLSGEERPGNLGGATLAQAASLWVLAGPAILRGVPIPVEMSVGWAGCGESALMSRIPQSMGSVCDCRHNLWCMRLETVIDISIFLPESVARQPNQPA